MIVERIGAITCEILPDSGNIMSKVREVFRELGEVEQRLRITERKLYRLKEDSWSYTKNMLKFGFASWVFGLSVFFLAIVAMSTELFGGAPLTWTFMLVGIPLLVGAPAAPMMMTAVSVRKFDTKIKRLRRIRSGLAVKYQSALYQYQMASIQYLKRQGLRA
ncbi:hypothetical protein ES703_10050 [subsurface metagenome]